MDCMDLTLLAHKMVVMVQASPQMTVAAVLFVSAEGEYRDAKSAETWRLFEKMLVTVSTTSCDSLWLTRLDITSEPTAGQAHH